MGKGDKPRFYPDDKYRNNFNKIFRKEEDKTITPQMYLDMWLSEQIPTKEWLEILENNKSVNELYQKHKESRNESN